MTQVVSIHTNKPPTNQTYVKVHVSLVLKQQLQHLARQRGVSVSSLLRLITNEYIKNKG